MSTREDRPPDSFHSGPTSSPAIARVGRAGRAILVAAILLIGLGIAAVALRYSAPASGPGNLEAQRVRLGDRVEAGGLLLRDDGSNFTVCVQGGSRLMLDELPGCDPRVVNGQVAGPSRFARVLGIRADDVPGWTVRQGLGYAEGPVSVRGRWLGDAIQADEIVTGVTAGPSPLRFPLPCPPPPGGWEAAPPPGRDLPADTGGDVVTAEAAGHPELYSGVWAAAARYPDGINLAERHDSTIGRLILVVGTVGDVATVRPHLVELYPYALCVAHVSLSATDLSAIANRLEQPDRTWVTSIEPDIQRVRVEMTVLDEAASARIGNDAGVVIVDPLVRKL
jgi:hypothetical protein